MKTIVALMSAVLLLVASTSYGASARARTNYRPRFVAPVRYSPTNIGVHLVYPRNSSSSSSTSSTSTASRSSGSSSSSSSSGAPATPPPVMSDPADAPTKTIEVTNADGSVMMKEVPASSSGPAAPPGMKTTDDPKQKARDASFVKALEDYKKDFPANPLPWE